MSNHLKIECTPGPGKFGGYSITITDDHIRAIVERALQLGCFDWISKHTHGNGTLSAEWPNQFTYAPSKDPCSFGTIQPAAPADASDLLSAGQVVAGPTPYVVAMVQSHPTLKVGDIVRMGDTGSPKHDNYLIRDDFSLHAIAGEHDQYVLLKRWQAVLAELDKEKKS